MPFWRQCVDELAEGSHAPGPDLKLPQQQSGHCRRCGGEQERRARENHRHKMDGEGIEQPGGQQWRHDCGKAFIYCSVAAVPLSAEEPIC